MSNQILAEKFQRFSEMLNFIGGEEHFRSMAYSKAAKIISALPENISVYYQNNTLTDLPGIGVGLKEHIEEYLQSGNFQQYEDMKRNLPMELVSLMKVKGFGPASLRKINKQLRIDTIEQLKQALIDGKVSNLKSFGKKKVDAMIIALQLLEQTKNRILLHDAMEMSDVILQSVKKLPQIKKAQIAGSLRRKKETIGDLDLLICCDSKFNKEVAAFFSTSGIARKVLAIGSKKVSVLLKDYNCQLDVRIVKESDWAATLLYFTGSKEHTIQLRKIAHKKGFKLSEYGLFNLQNGQKLDCLTEASIYKSLGINYIAPELREGRGEIEFAQERKMPDLVNMGQIRGDMHLHSNWSDGSESIENIANYLIKNFNYDYMVLTDHSRSLKIANGMDEEKLLKQIKVIQIVNKKLGKDFIKTGIEVNILLDGSLDLPDSILSQLDWVVASVHAHFTKDATDRLIAACKNPLVNCIGHPTGRLLFKRNAYPLNMQKFLEAAFITNTAVEINAQPNRMDLPYESVIEASRLGIKMVVSTDSHHLNEFSFMNLGLAVANRGWCKSSDILNTYAWQDILNFKNKKKMKASALIEF